MGQIQRLMKQSSVPKHSQSTGHEYVVMLGYLCVSCAQVSLQILMFMQHVHVFLLIVTSTTKKSSDCTLKL